jgi:gentisate 1,2-dioxygenase
VPFWSWHRHRNASDGQEAILFSINDRPMMEALNLYREEGNSKTGKEHEDHTG